MHVGWFALAAIGMAVAVVLSVGGCKGRSLSSAERTLVGEWFCKGDDYSFFLVLRSDGQYVQCMEGRPIPKPDGDTWRIEGDKLVLAVKQPDGRITETRGRYILQGDTLQWTREDVNVTLVYRRGK